MRRIIAVITDLLFPPHANCIACGSHRIGADGSALCDDCADDLIINRMPMHICIRCGHILPNYGCPFCKKEVTKHIPWMRAAYQYKGTVSHLVRKLKYSGIDEAGTLMAKEMALVFTNGNPPPVNILTYVPMEKRRLRARGENHARVLCQSVSALIGLPYGELLTANHMKKRQAGLPRAERLKNRKGSYSTAADVKGLRILLIDDVLTTGATAAACAAALRKSGAMAVYVLCAAFS